MKKREDMSLVVLLILLLSISIINGDIDLGDSGQPLSGDPISEPEVCTTDAEGNTKCVAQGNIQEYAQDFNQFNNLPSKLQEYTLNKENFDKFAEGFKTAKLEEQTKFFLGKDTKGFYYLSNEKKAELMKSLEKEKANELGKEIINSRLKKLYKPFVSTGEYPEIKSIDIDWQNIKFQGNSLIGEHRGYISLEKTNKLDSRVTTITYKDGEFSLGFAFGDSSRKINYKQGTFTNGYVVTPEGEKLGGKKGLDFLYFERPGGKWGKADGTISISYDEEGNAEIRIKEGSNPKSTFLRAQDIHGKDIYFTINVDNIDHAKDGKLPESLEPVIKIDKDNVLSVKSLNIETKGFGDYKVSNKEFTDLLGNVFKNPGEGMKRLEERFKDILMPKALEEMRADVIKIFTPEAIESANPEEVEKQIKEIKGNIIEAIMEEHEIKREEAEKLYGTMSYSESIGSIFQRATINYAGIQSVSSDLLVDFGVFISGDGIAKFVDGKGGLIGPAVGKTLGDALDEFASSYESYKDSGKNYLLINDFNDEQTGNHFYQVEAGGGYMLMDITDFKGKIGSLSVDNYGHEITNGKSNREIIYVNNGGFLLGFKGEDMVDSRGNQVGANRNSYFYNKARVPIDKIQNLGSADNYYYKLEKNNNRFNFYRSDDRVNLRAGETYLIGDRFGIRGSSFFVGGAQLINVPRDKDTYPMPDDARLKFAVNPQYLGTQRSFGWRIRNLIGPGIAVDKITSQAGTSTRQIANQIDDGTYKMVSDTIRGTFNGDLNKFYSQMELANTLITNADTREASNRILSNLFSGQNPQRMKDMVYMVNNENSYTQTLKGIANLNGQIRKGVSGGLDNKGFQFNGRYAPNQDPSVSRLLFAGSVQAPPPGRTMSTSQAEATANQGNEVRSYTLRSRLERDFGKSTSRQTPKTTSQTNTQSQTRTTTQSRTSYPRKICTPSGCRYVY